MEIRKITVWVLKNIKFALDKYNGKMEIEHTENIFTVILLMYLNDEPK